MIGREFFTMDPVRCARELIGVRLEWGECAGLIVETEAYDAEGDAACHTFFRPSARAFVERHEAGTAYVYLNYGMHWLLNVLVKGRRRGFVLIRALEPVAGLEVMEARRGGANGRGLCSGPGKLTQALGVTGADHGIDLCSNPERGLHPREKRWRVITDGRIGISVAQELPWRFTARDHPHVSVRVRGDGQRRGDGETRGRGDSAAETR
jgi:DNA-3-methyladenine glycosylase